MAYYSNELIDEITNVTDIVTLINAYVPLTKRGVNFIGLCPFHKEKTPSFTVSSEKQIFKCFGCGVGGDAISFVSKIENLDYKESLEFLADKGNIDLSRYIVSSSGNITAESKDEKERLYNLNKLAAKYFFEALNEECKRKQDSQLYQYLSRRQLDKQTIVRFGLGFGTNPGQRLVDYLKSEGFTEKEMLDAGVIAKSARGNIYECFASRLIFPILDTRDRVIGFGGRVLDKSLPKYVNSPENSIYHKGRNLYALNVAKRQGLEYIILTEGYMDTVAIQKNGIHNAIASLGTALTENQAKLMKKYTSTVIIAYDQDDAGQKATLRAIDILLKEGLKVKVLRLNHSDVKDPDEYIAKYGKEPFLDCVRNSISYVEYKIQQCEKNIDISVFDGKVEFLSKTATILSSIKNAIERDMYVDVVSRKYKVGKSVLLAEINKKLNNSERKISDNNNYVLASTTKNTMGVGTSKDASKLFREKYVVALALSQDKKLTKEVISKIPPDSLTDPKARRIYIKIIEILNSKAEDNNVCHSIIRNFDEQEDIEYIAEIMCLDLNSCDKSKLLLELESDFKKNKYENRKKEILKLLGDPNISEEEKAILSIELSQILKKLVVKK